MLVFGPHRRLRYCISAVGGGAFELRRSGVKMVPGEGLSLRLLSKSEVSFPLDEPNVVCTPRDFNPSHREVHSDSQNPGTQIRR